MSSILIALKIICVLYLAVNVTGCGINQYPSRSVQDGTLQIVPFSFESGLRFQLCRDCASVSNKTMIKVKTEHRTLQTPKFDESEGQQVLIYFSFDSDKLSTPEQTKLASFFNNNQWDSAKAIQITGYTDNIGPSHYNQLLSLRRAESVRRFIEKNYSHIIHSVNVSGLGACCYVQANETAQGRAKNRRVLLMFLDPQSTEM